MGLAIHSNLGTQLRPEAACRGKLGKFTTDLRQVTCVNCLRLFYKREKALWLSRKRKAANRSKELVGKGRGVTLARVAQGFGVTGVAKQPGVSARIAATP